MSRFKFNDVFVVDDDFVVRILITKILKNIGYEGHIHQFENGELALKFINEGTVVPADGQFNLILLDINMPTLDGWGFLERFGDLPEDKKFGHYITMITSSIDQSDKDIAFSFADVKDFIQKPVSVQLLKDFLVTHQLLEN